MTQTHRRLSTKAAAEAIGVSPNTLKSWLKDLPVNPERDQAGNFRFDERAIEVLQAIKELRGDGRSYDSIRVVIAPLDEPEVTQTSPGGEPEVDDDHPRVTQASPAVDTAAIVAQVVAAMREENELAEKYARATYEVGELRATLRGVETDRDRLARELAEARDVLKQLQAPPAQPQRTWWEKLLGR